MNTTNIFKRKTNRIKQFPYQGEFAYFITTCVFKNQPLFNDEGLINPLLAELREKAADHAFLLYAYCFMPDHLHLLLIGQEPHSCLVDFIKDFKQASGYKYKQLHNATLWQKSYYEHVVRNKESLNEIALYIFNNPVRKKIVDDYREYPHLGSDIIDIESIDQSAKERGDIDSSKLPKCSGSL